MDAVIIDQPECKLLDSFEGRLCEEIIELEMFKNAEKIVIKEKSRRLGEGKRYVITDSLSLKEYYEINQDTPCQFSLHEIDECKKLVNFSLPSRTSCICPCGESCTLKSIITLHPNTGIGFVKQTLSWCQPSFNVYNASGDPILGIDGSFAMMLFSIGRHRITDLNGFTMGDIFVNYSAWEGLHNISIKCKECSYNDCSKGHGCFYEDDVTRCCSYVCKCPRKQSLTDTVLNNLESGSFR